jgi:two-component system, cell cycle sensor histidine kinase and response regulator CckA
MQKEPDSLIRDAVRFEAFCTTAGCIAHEFGNFLTPFTTYPQLIKEKLPQSFAQRELLDVIEKTAEDMSLMLHQLSTLSSKLPPGKKQFAGLDINPIITALVTEIERSAAATGIVIKLDMASNLARVDGSADGVREALASLCWNAVEAMERGGRLSIKASRVHMERRVSASGLPIECGEYVGIRVTDTGAGVPEQIRERIFEPFVTTKAGPSRRRAGLGLTVAFKIMRDYRGAVDFESAPGKETTFSLYFPIPAAGLGESAGSVSQSEVAREEKALILRDKGRVLIVDDERTILRLFEMILTSAFPEVKIDMANNGAEAVEKFGSGHHGVILMDLHMPVMDGQEAFGRIEKLCKEQHWEMPSVVFCTGFDPSDMARNAVLENPAHCLLSKPVSMQILVETVKSRLA